MDTEYYSPSVEQGFSYVRKAFLELLKWLFEHLILDEHYLEVN